MTNPYEITAPQGVRGAKTVVLPNNYGFDLSMDTWWSAVNRARLYSDFTGLDALYSYAMKSSTIIRAAIDKRLRPLKARQFAVYINGEENKTLSKRFMSERLVRELIYQRGLANFTYARVVGVNADKETFVYPLRNLDTVNKAVKAQTYDAEGRWRVKSHVNLFWVQTSYQSEDTLGLLEPICRDYINAVSSQNNWQTASQFLAYQQMIMYFENGDAEMEAAAKLAASKIGLGEVIVAGKVTSEIDGKVQKDIELENVYGNSAADTFRIFKENIEGLFENIAVVVLGSSLLLRSAKNTNSERLVRAHLKGFNDICEADAVDVQDWFNMPEQKTKLAYLLDMPELENAEIVVKPSTYIDTGDVDTFTNMFEKLDLIPTESFVEKVGLDKHDCVGYEQSANAEQASKGVSDLRKKNDAKGGIGGVVVDRAKRLFNRNKPGNGGKVG